MDGFIARKLKRVRTDDSPIYSLPPSWRRAVRGDVAPRVAEADLRPAPSCPTESAPVPVPVPVPAALSAPALLRCTALRRAPRGPLSAVCVDLETTGFSAARDELVSIAAVELRWDGAAWAAGGRSFARVVRPARGSDWRAERVHGLNAAALRGAPTLAEVIPQLDAFFAEVRGDEPCGDRTIRIPSFIAHNAKFDAPFLARQLANAGWRAVWDGEAALTCTKSMFNVLYPNRVSDLTRACEFCGIDVAGRSERHDALQDAQLCAQLFLRFAEIWRRADTLDTY